MTQCCSVPMCSMRTTGHRFPTDEKVKEKWLEAIKRGQYVPSKYARICKQHFLPSDYEMPKESFSDNPRPRLKRGVVPSQFAWTKNNGSVEEQKPGRVRKRSRLKDPSCLTPAPSSIKATVPEIKNELEIIIDLVTDSEEQDIKLEKCDA